MRLVWQAFVAFLTIVGVSYTVLSFARPDDAGSYGFSFHSVSNTELIVDSVDTDGAAHAADVRQGDRLFVAGTPEDRISLATTANGDRLIIRNGSPAASETLLIARVSTGGVPAALIFVMIAARGAFLFMGALIAWRRPDDPAARSLATFLCTFGTAVSIAPDIAQITPVWGRLIAYSIIEVLFFIGAVSALTFACRFPRPPQSGWRLAIARSIRTITVVGIALSISRLAVHFLSPLPFPFRIGLLVPYVVLYCAVLVLVFASLIGSYRAMAGVERARMRWVLGTFVFGFSGLIMYLALAAAGQQENAVQLCALTIVAIPFGLAYVIFRHRIIDIGFVVNRAVVYGGVSVVVVGVFILFEWLLSHIVEQHSNASTLLQLGGALVLGLSVRFIHERVDKYVDDFFFRERHLAEAAIRRFAHEAALITDPDDLVRKTVDVAQRNAKLSSVAFYARHDGAYVPLRATFEPAESVNENDYAVLQMRAWHQSLDLHDTKSDLPGETAFPMLVRGVLAGFLLCGSKTSHESLAPDERSALSVLARDAGVALDSLRVRIIERELGVLSHEAGLPTTLRDRIAALAGEP
ncbi:MAG: hypothetical protein M3R51_10435 [Candidatus Eremiobacteraeota bacterium]|nr:hypothetical protein [Candidatus Eremiobacteraeota bacterium]